MAAKSLLFSTEATMSFSFGWSGFGLPVSSTPGSVFAPISPTSFFTSTSSNRVVVSGVLDLDFDRDGRNLGDFEGLLSRRPLRLLWDRLLLLERRLSLSFFSSLSFRSLARTSSSIFLRLLWIRSISACLFLISSFFCSTNAVGIPLIFS